MSFEFLNKFYQTTKNTTNSDSGCSGITNTGTSLSQTPLRRKVRKTSRRKRKRRRNRCSNGSNNNSYLNNIVNMDNIMTATSRTTSQTTATTCNKCNINVYNIRKIKLYSYINNVKNTRKYNCNCSKSTGSCSRKSCKLSKCSSNTKISLIVKNIVNLLLPTIAATTGTSATKPMKTTTKLAKIIQTPAVSSNVENRETTEQHSLQKVQLHLKEQQQHFPKNMQQQQCYYLHTTGKCKIKQQKLQLPAIVKSTQLNETETVPVPATLPTTTSSSSCASTTSPTTTTSQYKDFITSNIATILPKCKTVTTSSTWYTLIWPFSSTPASSTTSCYPRPSRRLHNHHRGRSSSSAASFSPTTTTAAHLLNELYRRIFMTLLVLSICHNNVLETSAASVKILRREVIPQQPPPALLAQVILPSTSLSSSSSSLKEKEQNRPHTPEQITQVYNHHHQQQQQQTQPQQPQPELYLSQIYKEEAEAEVVKDNHNNIFQPQIQPQMLPYHHHNQNRQQQQHLQLQQQLQQHEEYLTTQQTSFSHGMALETTYNHTFQSLSIIDGGLTVAVDTGQQNLLAVEEEMLKAASSSRGSDGKYHQSSSSHQHLYGNDGLGFYDANHAVDGNDMMSSYTETNSMPIFDFGMPRNITARTGHTEAVIKCRVDRLDDKSVSWIRKRDLHILTVGTATYTSDKRFQVTESKDSREWTLHVKSPQARDSGIYECQVNTEPKMSMAFQLNVIEISPDAKAVITGPADLHFKVGSAIILTCIVHQPSVKDIGPIYWYRGEYMITPFDINDNTHEENVVVPPVASLPGVTPMKSLTTTQNKVNVLEHQDVIYGGGGAGGGSGVGVVGSGGNTDSEHMPQILTNEITQDFAQRIAMESQLGDTMKSRLRISNAQTSDTGNYTCQPTTASSASVMVHVINDENPAAMQKSGANSFHATATKKLMLPLVCATMAAAIVVLYKICGYWSYSWRLSTTPIITTMTTTTTATQVTTMATTLVTAATLFSRNCIILTCCLCHVIYKNVLEGIDLILRRRTHHQHLLVLRIRLLHHIILICILWKMVWNHLLLPCIMVSTKVYGMLRAIMLQLQRAPGMVANNLKAVNMPTLKRVFTFTKRNIFQ